MSNEAFFAPNAYDAETEQLRRRQSYARALLDQSQSPEAAGEMVSGHYVPTFSGLKKMGMALMGRYQADAAEKEMAALSETRRAETQGDLSKYAEILRGREAGPMQADGPMEDGTAGYTVQAPAVAGDPMKAAEYLKGARDPSLQQFGMQQMMEQSKLQAQQQQAEALRMKFNSVLSAEGMTPQKALAMGVPHEYVKNFYESKNLGRAKVNVVEQNGAYVPIDEYGERPEGLPTVPMTGNPIKDVILGDGKGGFIPNAPLVEVKKSIAKEGSNRQTVTIEDKTAATEFIKALAESKKTNQGAVQSIGNAQNIMRLIDENKLALGPSTNVVLKLSEYMPVGGKDTQEKLANTRVLLQQMGQEVLANAHFLKPMSNTDIQIVQDIIGANPNIGPEAMRRGMELYVQGKRAQLATHNRDASQLRERSPTAFDYTIAPPPEYSYKPIGVGNTLPINPSAIDAEIAKRRGGPR